MTAVFGFGATFALAPAVFARKRRLAAERKAPRDRRKVDLDNIFDPSRKPVQPTND